jgi:hypothetical protein
MIMAKPARKERQEEEEEKASDEMEDEMMEEKGLEVSQEQTLGPGPESRDRLPESSASSCKAMRSSLEARLSARSRSRTMIAIVMMRMTRDEREGWRWMPSRTRECRSRSKAEERARPRSGDRAAKGQLAQCVSAAGDPVRRAARSEKKDG